MKAFLNLYRANLTEFLSNRRALFLTIAFPILFITIFGLVFTNQDKTDAKIGLAAAEPDDPVTRSLSDALYELPKARIDPHGQPDPKNAEHNPFSELKFIRGGRAALLEQLRQGHLDAVITLPAGLADQAARTKERALKAATEEKEDMADMASLLDDDDTSKPATSPTASSPPPVTTPAPASPRSATRDPQPTASDDDPDLTTPSAEVVLTIDPARQLLLPILQGMLTRVLDGLNANLTGQPQLLGVRTEAGSARELRTIDYLLPGILGMSLLQLGLFATAQPLVALRVQGVLKRLNATPLSRTSLLTAYVAFRLTIALFQTALCVLIGRYAFRVAMVGNWWAFAGWLFLGTLVFISMGFFMASVSKNEEVCIGLGNVINLPMILLSGVFFPVNHLARAFDYILPFVPLNYLGDALRQTMVDAPPVHSPGVNGLVLGVWVVAMTILSVRFFSWDDR